MFDAAGHCKQRSLRPHTRETYESQLRHSLGRFDNVELSAITPGEVRAWHGQIVNSDLNPNTLAKVYRLFRNLMGTAMDDGLLRLNPVNIKGAAVEHSIERPLLPWRDIGRLAVSRVVCRRRPLGGHVYWWCRRQRRFRGRRGCDRR